MSYGALLRQVLASPNGFYLRYLTDGQGYILAFIVEGPDCLTIEGILNGGVED